MTMGLANAGCGRKDGGYVMILTILVQFWAGGWGLFLVIFQLLPFLFGP